MQMIEREGKPIEASPDDGGVPVDRRPRVLVVDDDSVLCRAVGHELGRSFDIEAVLCFGFDEALSTIPIAAVDGAVVDVQLPDGCGLEILRSLRRETPKIELVAITGRDPELGMMRQLVDVRAAFIQKPFRPDDLGALAARTYEVYSGRVTALDRVINDVHLSQREREVLELAAEGHSAARIGERLLIERSTARTYLFRALWKLGLSGVRELRRRVDEERTATEVRF